jgi:CubicO group peptidase (beta-lactamase class C family)
MTCDGVSTSNFFTMKFRVLLALLGVLTAAPEWRESTLAVPLTGAPRPQPAAVPADLDSYVEAVMRAFEVPGISLAIVKDGKVVVAKGYGVRRAGDSTAVDARTLFAIGSNTKLFTSVALALLVEEGKIEWDAPVVRYLPWFRLSDPYVTRELTVRDLLVHRSGLGLGAGDLLWWPASTYTRNEIARRLKEIPLATSFRGGYAYDNVLYLVAGEVIEAVSGRRWEDFVGARILEKAGMSRSTVRYSDAVSAGNAASPHARVNGKVRVVEAFASENTNPAGGISSNAEDMAVWLTLISSGGRLSDGSRLFSEDSFRQLTTMVTPMPISPGLAQFGALNPNFLGYALGLVVSDYRGHKTLAHTGGLPGYVSRLLWIPDAGLGVAVLTNQESTGAFDSIAYHVADRYLGAPPTDWAAIFRKIEERARAIAEAVEKKSAGSRALSSRPSLPLTGYTGTYTDAWYGDIVVEARNDALSMRFTKTPSLVGDLEHWQHDAFIVRWRDRELRADAYVTFALNPDGTVDQAKMRAVSPATDFSFDFHDLLLKPKK